MIVQKIIFTEYLFAKSCAEYLTYNFFFNPPINSISILLNPYDRR